MSDHNFHWCQATTFTGVRPQLPLVSDHNFHWCQATTFTGVRPQLSLVSGHNFHWCQTTSLTSDVIVIVLQHDSVPRPGLPAPLPQEGEEEYMAPEPTEEYSEISGGVELSRSQSAPAPPQIPDGVYRNTRLKSNLAFFSKPYLRQTYVFINVK